MSRKTLPDFSPEDPLPRARAAKKPHFPNKFVCPIDETEDFYDPFSDLSLFLAGKIKSEILKENNPKQWSKKIQELLLKQILPEFNVKFPSYRLGATALKKTWEKVRLYLDSVDERKEALTPEGSLNVPFMIRENLKELLYKKGKGNLFPYHQAYQLAVKISECIATLDGTRTDLEEMASTIWSLQKHIITKDKHQDNCPYDKHSAIDTFIVRYQIEELSKNSTISQKELASRVQKKITRLGGLSRLRRLDDLLPSLWSIYAEKTYPYLCVHKTLAKEKIASIEEFIKNESASFIQGEASDLIHLVRRILLLYKLAAKMSKPMAEKQLEAAISYVLSLSSDRIHTEVPVLRQEVYAFIQYEIQLVKKQREEEPLEKVLHTLIQTFECFKSLPQISDQEYKDLEIIIWNQIHLVCNPVAKVPYYLRELIEEELTSVQIEYPDLLAQDLIHKVLGNLKHMQTLSVNDNPLSSEDKQIEPFAKKISLWSLQGDLICSSLYFDNTSAISKIIKKLWKGQNLSELHICHSDFIQKVLQKMLHDYPQFLSSKQALQERITILYKHFWYTDLRSNQESAFDRFIKWHYVELTNEKQMQFHEMIIEHLDDLCKNSLPLIPFQRDYVRAQTEAFQTVEENLSGI